MSPWSWLRSEIERLITRAQVAWLSREIKVKEWARRKSAAVALGELGLPEVVEPLAEALFDPHTEVHLAALDGLSKMHDRRAAEALLAALERCGFHPGIITALGRQGHPIAVGPLTSRLLDRHEPRRRAILAVLAQIDSHWAELPAAKTAVTSLIGALHSSDTGMIGIAVDVLAKTDGPEAMAALLEFVASGAPFSKEAANALNEITPNWPATEAGQTVVATLVDQLQALNATVRNQAAWILGSVRHERALKALADALHAGDCQVVATAIDSLGEMGRREAIAPLYDVFVTGRESLRARTALGKIDSQWTDYETVHADAERRLTGLAGRSPRDVVGELAILNCVLPNWPKSLEARTAIGVLTRVCNESPQAWNEAAKALDAIDSHWHTSAEAMAAVPDILTSVDPDLWKAKMENVIKEFKIALPNEPLPDFPHTPNVTESAVEVLGRIGDEQTVATLCKLLSRDWAWDCVGPAAVKGLASLCKVHDHRGNPQVIEALLHVAPRVFNWSAGPECVRPLIEALGGAQDPRVIDMLAAVVRDRLWGWECAIEPLVNARQEHTIDVLLNVIRDPQAPELAVAQAVVGLTRIPVEGVLDVLTSAVSERHRPLPTATAQQFAKILQDRGNILLLLTLSELNVLEACAALVMIPGWRRSPQVADALSRVLCQLIYHGADGLRLADELDPRWPESAVVRQRMSSLVTGAEIQSEGRDDAVLALLDRAPEIFTHDELLRLTRVRDVEEVLSERVVGEGFWHPNYDLGEVWMEPTVERETRTVRSFDRLRDAAWRELNRRTT